MELLRSQIYTDTDDFRTNHTAMTALVHELETRRATVRKGGGGAAHGRHNRQRKLGVWERITRLLDKDSPFLKVAPLAAYEMYNGEAPAAGLITGIGHVSSRDVMVVANDATVKGGTYFPMTVKKHLRAQ